MRRGFRYLVYAVTTLKKRNPRTSKNENPTNQSQYNELFSNSDLDYGNAVFSTVIFEKENMAFIVYKKTQVSRKVKVTSY